MAIRTRAIYVSPNGEVGLNPKTPLQFRSPIGVLDAD
jgi:hypothetical protein